MAGVFGYDPENRTYDSDPSVPSPLSLEDPIYREAKAAHKTAAEKQKDLATGFEKRRPKEEAESERAYAGAERAAAQPRPAIPRMERVESPPKPEDYHKMSMGYLGAMVLLGAFGGKFIRNAANAPLAAFNGALNGWQEGNLEAYKEKSAEWKEKQQQVLDNNRARLDEYRTILEDRNASIQDQMLRVKLVAAKHQDKMMYDRADAENWTGVAQAFDQGVAVQERAVAATDKIVGQLTTQNETSVERANQLQQQLPTPQGQQWFNSLSPAQQIQIKGFVQAYADPAPAQLPGPDTSGGVPAVEPPPGTPIEPAPSSTGGTPGGRHRRDFSAYGWPPAAIEDAARTYNTTGVFPTGLGRGGNAIAIAGEIRTRASELNAEAGKTPEMRANDWQMRKVHQLGLGKYLSGPQSNSITALNTVVSHLQTLRDLGDALKTGDYPRMNQLFQIIGRNTGNPAPTNFQVASQIVGTEVMKALVAAGAGGVGEREEIKNAFQQAGSPEQIHGAIDTVNRLLAGQLRSRRQGFQVATGMPTSMFDEMLLPEVKTYFDEVERAHHEGGGGAGGGKPKQVEQNGHIYQLGPDGNYHPVQ